MSGPNPTSLIDSKGNEQDQGDWKTYSINDGQNTGAVIKNSPGKIGGWYLFNNASTIRYVKLYNQTGAPTSTDTPKLRLSIPSQSGANIFNNQGIEFNIGIGIRVTTGVGDTDNTGPTTNDVQVNIFYK